MIKKDDTGYYVSKYNDELTQDGLSKAISRVKMAFPSLENGFYKVLAERIKEKGLTDQQLIDSINNVIDTCEYPTPVIGKFLNFDKKQRLYTYNEVAQLVDKGESMDYYKPVKLDCKTWWVRKA